MSNKLTDLIDDITEYLIMTSERLDSIQNQIMLLDSRLSKIEERMPLNKENENVIM